MPYTASSGVTTTHVDVGRRNRPNPASPSISSSSPTGTALTGPNGWLTIGTGPLAKTLPPARHSSARPVWNAEHPTTFCSRNGNAKISPNSPRLTLAVPAPAELASR